jgi:proteic killer suppression protein
MRIVSFRHKGLKRLYEAGSRRGLRSDLVAKIEDILHAIEQAQHVEQIGLFPGWKLHAEGRPDRRMERLGDWKLSVDVPS